MKLWTWQTYGFDICSDHVDFGKSHYYKHAHGIPDKYQRVNQRLGTDDLVWCFTVETEWENNQTTVDHRVCWILDVPIDGILSFVDEWLADRLLNRQECPNITAWRCWRKEAVQQCPQRPYGQIKFIDAKLKNYTGPWLTSEEGWRGFFLDEPESAENVTALLRCPINPDWTIARR